MSKNAWLRYNLLIIVKKLWVTFIFVFIFTELSAGLVVDVACKRPIYDYFASLQFSGWWKIPWLRFTLGAGPGWVCIFMYPKFLFRLCFSFWKSIHDSNGFPFPRSRKGSLILHVRTKPDGVEQERTPCVQRGKGLTHLMTCAKSNFCMHFPIFSYVRYFCHTLLSFATSFIFLFGYYKKFSLEMGGESDR